MDSPDTPSGNQDDRRFFYGDRDVSLGLTRENPALNLSTFDFSITIFGAELALKWYRELD